MNPWTRSLTAWLKRNSKSQPKRRSSPSLTVEQLEGREMLSASPIAFKANSKFYDSLAINGTLFFSTSGGELWKTDGTASGTQLVKDLDPMGMSTDGPVGMTNFNGQLYFLSDDPSNNLTALWKSDGTDAGTVLVKDLSTVLNEFDRLLAETVVVNGKLLLLAGGLSRSDYQLWQSDGTTDGTSLLRDFGPGVNTGGFTKLNGAILFFSHPNCFPCDSQLWRSDGTDAGTFVVEELPRQVPYGFSVVNGTYYFETTNLINPSTTDLELWKTDGTNAGIKKGAMSATVSLIESKSHFFEKNPRKTKYSVC
jgi:ELWxxDGT repeat protein